MNVILVPRGTMNKKYGRIRIGNPDVDFLEEETGLHGNKHIFYSGGTGGNMKKP